MPRLLGLVVAVAGAVAFYTVDRKQKPGLPRRLANILAVGTLGVLYFEYRLDETQRIPALAHWLVYLQLIKYFLPKTAEDDWFLFLLGLMQVLIGSVVNQSDQVGSWLFLWAMLAVWVLGQFFLQREALRFSGGLSLGTPCRSGLVRNSMLPELILIEACLICRTSPRPSASWSRPSPSGD